MLPHSVQQQIQLLVDAEFEHRSQTLPATVEAKLRRLVADRGQGGHLTSEVSTLLASELRERIQVWAQTILRVLHTQRIQPSASLLADFRTKLLSCAARDREMVLSMMTAKYKWLKLNEGEIDFAVSNEIEKQYANASLYRVNSVWQGYWNWIVRFWIWIVGAIGLVASVVGILEYLGISLRG